MRQDLFLFTLFAVNIAASSFADDDAKARVPAIDQEIVQLKEAEQQAQTTVVEARSKLQTLEQQLRRQERRRDAAIAALEALVKQKQDKEAAAIQVQRARTKAAAEVTAREASLGALKGQAEAADEPVQQAEQQLAAAKQQLTAAEAAVTQPAAELLQLLEGVSVQTEERDAAAADATRLSGECDAVRTVVTQCAAASEAASQQRLNRERQLQELLVQAGTWVSFTDEVAPILQQRCVACHNARAAKGRLNLESYAALSQGGESGPALVAGNTADSPLCSLIADGSMPQDAAPLTPEQVQTLTRWVEYGGRLDAGVDAAARLSQVMPRRPQPLPPDHYPSPLAVTALAWSPDGAILATSGYHELLLWNAADGTLLRRIPNVAESVYDLSFHPDGTRLAAAAGTPSSTGELKVFRTADGELLADLVRMEDVMLTTAFSPDGSRLAAGGADRSIRLFDASTYAALETIEDHADWVQSIAWSPDGTRIVSASRDKTSKVFNAAAGEAVGTFNGHGETVYGVAVTTDGKQAVTCGADKLLRVWNIEDAKEVRKIPGAKGEVLTLSLLADGRAVNGGSDQTVRVEQIADGKTLLTLAEHPDWVYAIDVSAATKQIATGCADGKVRLWNLDTGDLVREWPASP